MGRWSFQVTTRCAAPVEVVWPLVAEAERWKEWSMLTGARLLRAGDPVPDGVGALRRFTIGGVGSQEEVVAWEAPHHLAYVLRKGFPVRNYRADVFLRPDGEGTALTWRSTFDALVPGTGLLCREVLHWLIAAFARQLRRATARRVAPH